MIRHDVPESWSHDEADQAVRLILEGHVALKYAGKGGHHGEMDGSRIELRRVEHGVMPNFSDLIDRALDGRMRR